MHTFKNHKILTYILVSCLFIGGLLAAASCTEKKPEPSPEKLPIIKGNGVSNDMKENIFSQLSEPNESLGEYISHDESDRLIYAWDNIGNLLHKTSDEMKIEDYVVLMQILQVMTTIDTDKAVTDFQAVEEFVRRGCDENGLTLTTANVATLYKEWVEDILIMPYSRKLLIGTVNEDERTFIYRLQAEMTKAGILYGFVICDNDRSQNKEFGSGRVSDIAISEPQDSRKIRIISIGIQTVKVYGFYEDLSSHISQISNMPSISEDKKDKLHQLISLSLAYSMGGVLIVSEDFSVQMLHCFNDTELEIRARAYGEYINKVSQAAEGDPKYQDISWLTLKAQLDGDEPTELAMKFTDWYFSHGGSNECQYHKNRLESLYYGYLLNNHRFIGYGLRHLSPSQIIELDKKLKDENYHLDLGDPP